MKCRPFAWLLWGLLPILALIGYTLYSETGNIESDLTGRMQSKLDTLNLGWARPNFEGRDGTLKGLTLEEKQRVQAASSVKDLYGVRILADKTRLTPAVDPYVWKAQSKEKTVTLEGYVPSTKTAENINKNAKSLFPGYKIVDNTKLARGADDNSWTHQTNFALTQLKNLKTGETKLSNSDFSIKGRAASPQSYQFVKKNIHNNLTSGLILKEDAVLPPIISPYEWHLTQSNNIVTLDGYVPSEANRKALKARIKGYYPKAKIVDNTQIAQGAADNWLKTTSLSSEYASRLQEGKASLIDKTATIEGSVPDYDTYDKVTADYKAAALPGYTHNPKLTSLKSRIPTVSPYTWNLVHSGDTVTLDGYVPNEKARAALLEKVKEHHPGATVTDNTVIAHGAPEQWLETATIASANAAKLQEGKASLTDTKAEISGKVPDYPTYDKVTADYKAVALPGYTHSSKLTSLKGRIPTASPYTWNLVHSGDTVTLDGYVPNEKARADLLEKVKKHHPGATVTDNTVIAHGAPEQWLETATIASANAAKLQEGKASLTDTKAEISGKVPDYPTYDKVTADYKAAALPGYTHSSKLTSLKARTPTISPYTWNLVHSGDTVTLDGYVPSEKARATLLNRVKKHYPGATITDNTMIAKGAPKQWLKTATIASANAAKLQEGKASLTNTKAEISGTVPDYPTYDKVTADYKAATLPGYTHSSKLTSLKARIPTASPYTWMAESKKDTLILRGYVPNEKQHAILLQTAKDRFPGKTVIDNMVIAKGAPNKWLRASKHGLKQLSTLDYGSTSLNDKDFNLTGHAKTEEIKTAIQPVGRSSGFTSTLDITAPKPVIIPEPEKVVEAVVPEKDITGAGSAKICGDLIRSFLSKEKINFRFAKASISQQSHALLDNLTTIIQKCPDTLIEIQGHTDADGPTQSNQILSAQRAGAVYNYLVAKGVDKSRMEAKGYGETVPLVPNTTKANKAQNRRIEFKLRVK